MSTLAHISIEQYDRMVEAGVFSGREKQRIELIHGELRQMNPIGIRHSHVVDQLTEWSFETFTNKEVHVRIQATLRIPASDSSPEPDLMWLERNDYSQRHPEPKDVLLLIEVADDSLKYDLGEKASLYAEAGIEDYWVIDLRQQAIHVHRQPQSRRYSEVTIVQDDEPAQSLRFPQATLTAKRLFE